MRKLLALLLITLVLPSVYAVNLEKLGQVGLDKGGAVLFEKLSAAAGPNAQYASVLFGVLSGDSTGAITKLIIQEAGKANPDIEQLAGLIEKVQNPLSAAEQTVLEEAVKSLNKEQAKAFELLKQLQENQPFFDALLDDGQKGIIGIAENGDLSIKDEAGNVIFKVPKGTEIVQDPDNLNRRIYNKINGEVQILDKTINGVTSFSHEALDPEQGIERIIFNSANAQYADRADTPTHTEKGTYLESLTGQTVITTRAIHTAQGKTTELLSLESTIGRDSYNTVINGKKYIGFKAGDRLSYHKPTEQNVNTQLVVTRASSNSVPLDLQGKADVMGSFTLVLNGQEEIEQLRMMPNGVAMIDGNTINKLSSAQASNQLFVISSDADSSYRINFNEKKSCETCDITLSKGKITVSETPSNTELVITKKITSPTNSILEAYTLSSPAKTTVSLTNEGDQIDIGTGGTASIVTPGNSLTIEKDGRYNSVETNEGTLTEPVPPLTVLFNQQNENGERVSKRATIQSGETQSINIETLQQEKTVRTDTVLPETSLTIKPDVEKQLSNVAEKQFDQALTTNVGTEISLAGKNACVKKTSPPGEPPKLNPNKLSKNIDDFDATIRQTAAIYQTDVQAIKSFMVAESNGDFNAVSPAGAVGPTQIQPITAIDVLVGPSADHCKGVYAKLSESTRPQLPFTEEQIAPIRPKYAKMLELRRGIKKAHDVKDEKTESALKGDLNKVQKEAEKLAVPIILKDEYTAFERTNCYYSYLQTELTRRNVITPADDNIIQVKKIARAYNAGLNNENPTALETIGHVVCVADYYKRLRPNTPNQGNSGTAVAAADSNPSG